MWVTAWQDWEPLQNADLFFVFTKFIVKHVIEKRREKTFSFSENMVYTAETFWSWSVWFITAPHVPQGKNVFISCEKFNFSRVLQLHSCKANYHNWYQFVVGKNAFISEKFNFSKVFYNFIHVRLILSVTNLCGQIGLCGYNSI